jgi:hypothetical protein
VDYLADNKMELVYYAYKTTGGPGLIWRVQLPRVDPIEVDSLTPVWPGAEFQEREVYDLHGILFRNHPDLRRMFMWEGFEGYPMRRDWKEPFYEEDFKPFKSRWPEGSFFMSEDKNPHGDNIQFRPDFDPEKWTPGDPEALLYDAARRYQSRESGLTTITSWSTWDLSTPQHTASFALLRSSTARQWLA